MKVDYIYSDSISICNGILPKESSRNIGENNNNCIEEESSSDDEDNNKRCYLPSRKCDAVYKNEKNVNVVVNNNNNNNNDDRVIDTNNRYRPSGVSFGRSLSLDVHLCEACNIREKLGRNSRRPPKVVTTPKRAFKKSEWLAILALGLVDFIGFCSMSVMAPFFPSEAAKKGMDVSHAGYVFSFYALIMFITSPIFGKLLPIIGTKFMFMSGVFLTGGCNILFGLLPMIKSNTQFAVFCFLVRGLEALGAGAFSTASFIYVTYLFPDNISAVLGILETFAGLGMSIGPALGGFLYAFGGFPLPFYTLGIIMICVLPLYQALLPPIYSSNAVTTHDGSFFHFLKNPAVFILFLIIVVSSNVWSFLDPTLEPHLRQLNLTSQQMGLVFLVFSALYGIFSPIWGYVGDECDNHWSMMAIGLIISAFGLILLGPSPIIPYLNNTLWLNLIALCILGVSVSLTLAPTFKALLQCATEKGYDTSLSTYSVVAGIWSCAYSLGDMTGPSLGGILLEKFNFIVCSTTMAIIAFVMGVICAIYFGLWENYRRRYRRNDIHSLLLEDKLAYYGALSNNSDSLIITVTNGGACEV